MKALVSLVGAGPGDPGLLTLKAQARLREADLIVYDYLANPAHLHHAKKDAIKIGVGKGFRHKILTQDKINRLIVSSSRRGKRVVRLKGGDPYLFGRGGEEALFLEKHGIPFEVVPGVTSATACAAYAGIPLTHRDHNASVTFLTGHRAEDDSLDSIPWKKIAEIGGTLVIYMGFYNLSKIARQLILAGMNPATPVAVIEWGTLPRQKSVSAKLSEIAAHVQKAGLAAPCMILIGDVVNLGKKLAWFERLPLFGRKVVLTRAEDRMRGFREKLAALGGEAIELPLIRIEKPASYAPVDKAVRSLHGYDWLVFASAYGVRSFFERLRFLKIDTRALKGVRIAGVGPKTAEALQCRGIYPDLLPEKYDMASLAAALKKKEATLKGKKFLFPRGDKAPSDFEDFLKKNGARVTRVTAYRTLTPGNVSSEAKKRVSGGEADYVAFTSASTVHGFVRVFGKEAARKIARKTRFLSIGPLTSKTLKSYALTPFFEAKTATVDGLIDFLVQKEKPGKKR